MFAGLPAKDLSGLEASALEDRLAPRQYAFREDDPARWFCLVVSGHVKIVRQSKAGKEIVLELLGPGEPFGGVAVIERRPYPASAQATEPSVILKIPGESLLPVADRHPSIMREMTLMIARRLRTAHDTMQSLAMDPVEARLAAMLLRLAEREGTRRRDGVVLAVHLTRQTLADMSGTTVETAIRVMSRWQRKGLVIEEAGHLVLDTEALRAVADSERAGPSP